jgi:hypothetical protein
LVWRYCRVQVEASAIGKSARARILA